MIPYGKQSISDEDIDAVVEVLRSGFLTCGPKVDEFEAAFAALCGAKYAVACSNGTAALHIAMMVAGIGEGDRIVTSPITFLASANAGRYVGAEVDFCDVEPVAATLDAQKLREQWREGTKAVVAVDYAGHPADHRKIAEVAHENGAVLIQDACHSVGGCWSAGGEELRVGSLPWVDMAAFSFHPVKTMTTGEGGMLVTDNQAYAEQARSLRSHGMVRDSDRFVAFEREGLLEESGPWAYEMHELGFNYRITDIQCALGLSQLSRLPHFVARRQEIVKRYNEGLAALKVLACPGQGDWIGAAASLSWHLYTVRVDFETLGMSRIQFMEELRKKGVGSQVLYIPVNEQPYYKGGGADVPEAEKFYRSALSLPLFPAMTDEDVDCVIASVLQLCQGA